MCYIASMNQNAIDKITKLLKLKFWFGGKLVYPWLHPNNRIQNCAVITLDGCVQYKFKAHKNGKLRVIKICSDRYLALGLKRLQTITLEELYVRIGGKSNDLASSFLQLTSPVPIPVDIDALREVEMIRRQCNQVKI